MVKSGGSKSSHGSHHDSDEEEVTMPIFDANLPTHVKDGLEVACRSLRGVLLRSLIVCRLHVGHMLDMIDADGHHLNLVSMMPRMRAQDCTLMGVYIIVAAHTLLVEVLLTWRGLLMMYIMIIGFVELLGSVSFKPTSSVFKAQSKVESFAASGSKTRSVECYTCGGRGHYMRDCPNQKKVLMTKGGYISESLSEKFEGECIDYTHATGYPDVDDLTITTRFLAFRIGKKMWQ
uniref:CCHC-type domain-containing protein n=1 Tax=Leersia perrieri TaxID=77586 RepID=A0A0D9VWC4_9ORYZ